MTKSAVTLDDKYTQRGGRVFISSNQALVRLPLDQARRDRAAGLKTGGYISGYRGSPLGVYDSALWAAQKLLDAHDIRFVPGLNEELAVSALRGTQELQWFARTSRSSASRTRSIFPGASISSIQTVRIRFHRTSSYPLVGSTSGVTNLP